MIKVNLNSEFSVSHVGNKLGFSISNTSVSCSSSTSSFVYDSSALIYATTIKKVSSVKFGENTS